MRVSAIDLVQKLQNAGYEAYFAGGSVRDMLLGKQPKDFDIVTSARPEQLEELFPNTKPVGKAFGVILIHHLQHQFEVASFRSDSGSSDGRRPDAIIFSDAASDAKRRDFTINGIFYDPIKDQIHDFVEGQKDLDFNLIRFIGNPSHRIKEDHLRILRAIRFKNTLNFQYEPETWKALTVFGPTHGHQVAMERINQELSTAILYSEKISKLLGDLHDLGMLSNLIPELLELKGCAQPAEFHQEGDVWTHTMQAVDSLPTETGLIARLATLFHDIGKPATYRLAERIRFDSHAEVSAEIAAKILRRLKFSKQIIDSVCWCISHHMMMMPLLDMNDGRKAHWYLNQNFPELLSVMEADIKGTTPSDLSLYQKIHNNYLKISKKHKSIPKPYLDGKEIMELLKITGGPQITEIKQKMQELQIEKVIKSKLQAKRWLKENFSNSQQIS